LLPWDSEDAEKAAQDRERIKRWQESERYGEKAVRRRPLRDPVAYADKLRLEECLGLVQKIVSDKLNPEDSGSVYRDDARQELVIEAAKLIKPFRGDTPGLMMHLKDILRKRFYDVIKREKNTAGLTGQPHSRTGRYAVYDEAAIQEYGEADTEEEKYQLIRRAGTRGIQDGMTAVLKQGKKFVATRAFLEREKRRIEAIDFEKGTRQWLSDSERHILRLRRIGFTTSDIAKVVRESQATISRRLSEIQHKLKEHLGYLPAVPVESSPHASVHLKKLYSEPTKQPSEDPEQWHREHLDFWSDVREGFKKSNESGFLITFCHFT